MKGELIAIDLCCGAGGWACATRGLPFRIGMAVDLWGVACTTYRLNHPETDVIEGDLRKADVQRQILRFARDVPAGRLVVLGGVPCEWLSCYRNLVKVKAREIAEERETLDAVLGLVRKIEPRWWCLEDVKQLAKELPILTPWREINARNYSAQRRKRIFVGDFPRSTPGGREVQG